MLTPDQLRSIDRLKMLSEEADQVELKLDWYFLVDRKSDDEDFFYYEGGQLLGYAALYYIGGAYELSGMVHPEHRQKGIFTKLLNEATEVVRKNGVDTIYISAPENAKDAEKTLDEIGAKYAYSEYEMRWKATELPKQQLNVQLRMAERKDFDRIVELDQQAFNLTREEAEGMTRMYKEELAHRLYMIEYEGEAVGKIRLKSEGLESYIFGFAIDSKYQKMGSGKSALIEVVRQEKEDGHSIFVEVNTKNVSIENLYQPVGFEIYRTQHFYEYNV